MPEGGAFTDHHDYLRESIIDLQFMQNIEEIGPKNFRSIGSDNTGNTTLARAKINEDYPWILIAPDACHRLHRLCGDICDMEYFKPVRFG